MKIKLPVIFVLLLLTVAISCKKNDDIIADQDRRTANLVVVNASLNVLNYYRNGTRVNNTSSLYPLGSTGYIGVPVGERNYEFKKDGNPNVLFGLPLTLDSGMVYSLYVAGETNADTFTSIDTLVADKDGKAMVRFVNASPGAGTLDLAVGDTVRFRTRAYKTTTVFLPVGPGRKRIRVYQPGSAAAVIDETRILQANRVYTLFTSGQLNGTGSAALGTGLVVNK